MNKMINDIVFFDTEIGRESEIINDIGAISENKGDFHERNLDKLLTFISNAKYLCGHNVINHDIKYIGKYISNLDDYVVIDTLFWSPLLYPKHPYHKLLKDDKLQSDELNNPLNDSKKARDLFYDEVNTFKNLSEDVKKIYYCLLYDKKEFKGLFNFVNYSVGGFDRIELIKKVFKGKICDNADIGVLIKNYPIELSYALSIIGCDDFMSLTPYWVYKSYPKIENVMKFLCNTPCGKNDCAYCNKKLDIHRGLYEIFGFPEFRKYEGEPLQEKAVQAAVNGESLLAVFPTGGGKSITFQLPAIMAGKNCRGLTVVVSPLQSLMKDQVDNLSKNGIDHAVTINGLLDPIERKNMIERVANGNATLLYISPEQFRSKTIERLLLSRNIIRFVIDEAHCFSAWGQDFRVDYLYIGDFIKKLQSKKQSDKRPIPVSCFTATAKQKVISDICDYFKRKLDIDFKIFASTAARTNLHYNVIHVDDENDKYSRLRSLIEAKRCPTIVYVSRTGLTKDLSNRLTSDGFKALPFNGKMDSQEKVVNQEAFMNDEVSIMVATSAFGMGVDKKDVGLVIHYDISDSLENYVQEAGRAGRDPSLDADCYVLYNDSDLDKHFLLLNQTKLSISEIQQVWKAIKDLSKNTDSFCSSALEIAKQAGWDTLQTYDIETRVKTALLALENAGYIKRGMNVPRVYATSIRAKNMDEASYKIRTSPIYSDIEKENALRIIKSLISSRSVASAGNDDAESRVDYLADILGLKKEDVINAINLMKQDGLLEDYTDMSAYIFDTSTQRKSKMIFDESANLEKLILSKLKDGIITLNFKELNEEAIDKGITKSSVRKIRAVIHFLAIKNYIKKEENKENCTIELVPSISLKNIKWKYEKRIDICKFIIDYLFLKVQNNNTKSNQNKVDIDKDEKPVEFSLVELFNGYKERPRLDTTNENVTLSDVEDALLYLSRIDAIRIEGGFLVLYSGMEIKRIIKDNYTRYKQEDYKMLNEFYKQKIQQIHIVGEYANMMTRDYNQALIFVQDYFNMDYKKFISTYFKGEKLKTLERNITQEKYDELFGRLSDVQDEIISDKDSKNIVVAAGPGSGKTMVLVHKLASLILMEDVKHEQLLMLTFSRAAATEFKKRLYKLIGGAAHFVDIKTFHSYCFDLIGKIGDIQKSKSVIKDATEMIRNGEVEEGKITKTVLVIDEAQDMNEDEFNLVLALKEANADMRIIAVGDDDQNIYEFRESSSKYLKMLIEEYGATKYEMIDNYRSCQSIINLSNAFVKKISNRMKESYIQSTKEEKGETRIIQYHTSANMEEPIINDVITCNYKGSTCILTNTNEEAYTIYGLLLKNNKKAKLIQSADEIKIKSLVEVKYFVNLLGLNDETVIIDNNVWDKAKEALFLEYKNSACLNNVMNMLADFESTNEKKYRSDFEEYIFESNYEDFYNINEDKNDGVIYVSTIHKSKGREFDNVFIMLKNAEGKTEEEIRKIYVGMTRAKNVLHIHVNTLLFTIFRILGKGVSYRDNYENFNEPSELVMRIPYKKGTVLSYSNNCVKDILKLRPGDILLIDDIYLVDKDGHRVACLAEDARIKMLNYIEKGYKPEYAEIQFILMWAEKNNEKETGKELPIIISNLYYKKT